MLQCGVSGIVLALLAGGALPAAAAARDATGPVQPRRQISLQTDVPPGFENLPTRIESAFDIFYLNRRIGSFRAVVDNGRIRFLQPELIVAALGPDVSADDVRIFLSQPLDTNQNLVCFPGQTENCGVLPPGRSGVIVSPDTFSVQLFLARDLLLRAPGAPTELGPPVSGPSFIQNALVSLSTTTAQGDRVRFGGTFDTYASLGRSALIAQTVVDDQRGARLEYGYYQYTTNRFVGAAGLFSDYSSLLLNNYQMAGAQFGSNDRLLNNTYGQQSPPIEVVLPRPAIVELYRNGVLLSTRRYDGGLQLIDTNNLPQGSYNVDIVARDGAQVVLRESRTFTKANDIPPPGRTLFNIGAGVRVNDGFLLGVNGFDQGFFPQSTGEFVATARAARRIGRATGVGASLLLVGSGVYGEASVSTLVGSFRATAAAAVGSDGGYGAYVTGAGYIRGISFNLTARKIHAETNPVQALIDRTFAPFLRSEDSVIGTMQFQMLGGSVSLSGSYARSSFLPDRYTIGARYARSADFGRLGTGLISAFTSVSNFETRVGLSISFVSRVDRRTTLSYAAGGEYADGPNTSARQGFSPIARAALTRRDTVGQADLVNEIGASTDATNDRAYLESSIFSSRGSADGVVQYEHDATGRSYGSLLLNGQTGIAIGGGRVRIGLRQPGDSMVLVDVDTPRDEASSGSAAQGGYRLRVDNQSYDLVRPGSLTALGLQSLANYRIGLQPENAPAYDIDLSDRVVPLYPGNVVLLHWRAERSYTLFGQIVDVSGAALSEAHIRAGSDFNVADDNGYFTITATRDATLEIQRPDGTPCLSAPLGTFLDARASGLGHAVQRIGMIRCAN